MSRQLALGIAIACVACGGGGGNPTLTVVLAGTATEGSVNSTAGIDCGTACTIDVTPGVIVPLAALVPAGVVFMGWDGGGCTGTATDCMVTVTDDVTITATFDQKLEAVEIPAVANHAVDVLIVNANDTSTLEEQYNLKNAIPAFIDTLEASFGEPPDLHLGVVTSDMGTLGVPLGDPRCDDSDGGNLVKGDPDLADQCAMIAGNYIETSGSGSNVTGPLSDALSCMLFNTDRGCAFEQHLESMRAALNNNPANAGFLRPSALLAIVIRSDQDDCSVMTSSFFGPESAELGPVTVFRCFEKGIRCAEGRDIDLRAAGPKTDCVPDEASTYFYPLEPRYVAFLHTLKPDPRDVIVGVLAGDPAPVDVASQTPTGSTTPRPDLRPSCDWQTSQGNTVTADPGIRLAAFANLFGPDRGIALTECAPDYAPQLRSVANRIRHAGGYPCLDGELYAPEACTLQYSTGAAIAHCTAALDNPPCWHVEVDATACAASPSHLRVIVEDPAPPLGAYVEGSCRIN